MLVHSGNTGNEKPDKCTGGGSSTLHIGTEPAVGVTKKKHS